MSLAMSLAARGLGWNVVGQIARAIAQFVLGVVLARLLGPEAFGVMAVGWLAVAFCRLIDPGMGSSLVKLATPTAEDIRYASTLQVGVSLVLGTALALSAVPVARVLGDAAAAPFLQAMAVLLPLFAFAQIGNALLELKLDFRTIQLANLVPYLIGYLGVGVPLAVNGAGPWALVAASVIQNLLTTCWLYTATRHPWRPLFRTSGGAQIVGFGAHTSGVALASYVASNADQVAVSHSGTASDLGQYNRASALLSAPMLAIGNALTNWLYPLFVRQTIAERQRGFIAAVAGLVLVTAVPFAMVAGCAGSVVTFVYGPDWGACALFCVPLSLSMPAWLLGMVASPLLWSCDAIAIDHRRQWFATAGLVAALSIGMSFGAGPLEIAWIVCGCSWLRAGLLLSAAQSAAQWSWFKMLYATTPNLGIAAVAGIGASWIESALHTMGWYGYAIVGVVAVAGVLIMAISWRLGRALDWHPDLTAVLLNRGSPT